MNLVSPVTDELTLERHVDRYAQNDPLRGAVAAAINAFAFASIEISELVGRGALAGITGQALVNRTRMGTRKRTSISAPTTSSAAP
jgi:hypothetical protein